jgi:soluble lytic murein transglycosylase-like protein
MRRRLQSALMAIPITATLLSFSARLAASDGAITISTDEAGHKVYVNDDDFAPPAPKPSFHSDGKHLVYWSSTEHRWKGVPRVHEQAAKTAAAEVNRYLEKPAAGQNSSPANGFTQREIDTAIEKAAARHNVDANLVRALVKVESNFNPNAISRKGAMGLMQLMPTTARQLKVTNPFNPEENVDAGVRHLKQLLESYGGDVRLSLAAYNAGSGAVSRNRGIPKYRETQNYVRRITGLYGAAQGSGYFGSPRGEPVKLRRDERGMFYISNTD